MNDLTKNFRAIWRAIRWALSILLGLVLLTVEKPCATCAIPKFIILKVRKIPRRIWYEARLSKVGATIAQHLDECALIYLEQEPEVNEDTLKWLKALQFPGKMRWGSLYLLVRRLKPRIVVETGVCEGKSASYILQGLADNGEGLLISIDLPNRFYLRDDGRLQADFLPFKEQPGRLIQEHLRDRWELILVSSKKKLPEGPRSRN